jgi:hypothetical protein
MDYTARSVHAVAINAHDDTLSLHAADVAPLPSLSTLGQIQARGFATDLATSNVPPTADIKNPAPSDDNRASRG